MTNRQKQAEATKEALCKAGDRLFCRYGFDDLTIEQITTEAGVAKGTFYHYFKNKHDLFNYIDSKHNKNAVALIRELGDVSTEDKLRKFLQWYGRDTAISGYATTINWLISKLQDRNPDGSPLPPEHFFETQVTHDILANGVQTGELLADTPVDALTRAITTGIFGLLFLWCRSCGEGDFVRFWVEEWLEHTLKPILAPYKAHSDPV